MAQQLVWDTQPLLKQIRDDRQFRKETLFNRINPSALLDSGKLSGTTIRGRDEKGNPAGTKTLSSFGMRIYNSNEKAVIGLEKLVRIPVYPDDRDFLSWISSDEANRLVKVGQNERKEVVYYTDIYHGVRLFKHMREGYKAEHRFNNRIVEKVEEFNATLATIKWNVDNAEIERLLAGIAHIGNILRKKYSASKQLALEKLSNAGEFLEDMKVATNAFERTKWLACASCSLVAFRNRFEWRLKEMLNRGSMACLKERSLRMERDRALRHNVERWLDIIDRKDSYYKYTIRSLWARDLESMKALDGLKPGNIEETLHKLKCAHSDLGRSAVDETELLLKKGMTIKAEYRLRRLNLTLSCNKPSYISEQLEKTGDEYLTKGGNKSFAAYVKTGAELFSSRLFDRAKYCFSEALKILDSIDARRE